MTERAEFDVIPISPLLMLRVPLVTTEELPNGRVPALRSASGPGFVSIADIDATTAIRHHELEVGVDAPRQG